MQSLVRNRSNTASDSQKEPIVTKIQKIKNKLTLLHMKSIFKLAITTQSAKIINPEPQKLNENPSDPTKFCSRLYREEKWTNEEVIVASKIQIQKVLGLKN